MTADIWDYQQYISGDRFESFMGSLNMLTAAARSVYGVAGADRDAGMGLPRTGMCCMTR
jgi:hypothetical protein